MPDRTEPPNGVKHMRRVYEDEGGEGKAFYADTRDVGWWPMAGRRAVF